MRSLPQRRRALNQALTRTAQVAALAGFAGLVVADLQAHGFVYSMGGALVRLAMADTTATALFLAKALFAFCGVTFVTMPLVLLDTRGDRYPWAFACVMGALGAASLACFALIFNA